MDNIVSTVLVGITVAAMAAFLRSRYPEYAFLLAGVFYAFVFLLMFGGLKQVVDLIDHLASRASWGSQYVGIVMKVVAISYLAAFGAQLSRDAKEETVAVAIETAAKVIIILLGAPVIVAILEALVEVLP